MELVYARVNRAVSVALDNQMPLVKTTATWALNSGQRLYWGPLGRIDNHPLGVFFYRPYDLGEARRPCFAFLVEWDQIYEDPQGRPGKVLFGYYCGQPGDALGDHEIRTIARGITILFASACQDSENPVNSTPESTQQPASTSANANENLKNSGNSVFPFRFARHYTENGGSKIR